MNWKIVVSIAVVVSIAAGKKEITSPLEGRVWLLVEVCSGVSSWAV